MTMKHLKRTAATLAALAVLGLVTPPATQGAALWDTAGHWARAQIAAGVSAGYLTGFPDGSFRPDQPITRAEFFTMLTGALGLRPRPGDAAPYAAGHWSARQGHVQAAVAAGLLDPTSDYNGWLEPDRPIARREIVLAAVRALGHADLVGQRALAAPDAASYPTWLQAWAAEAVHLGVLQGYEDGSVGLERTATRAEALVMVQRIRDQLQMDAAPTQDEPAPEARRWPAPGEPTWTVDRTSPNRPLFSDGQRGYTLGAFEGYTILPAPGGAAWVNTVDEGGTYRLYRLAAGCAHEVAAGAAPIVALAVGDDGRLWFSRGADLVAAAGDGRVLERHALSGQVSHAALDENGVLWAVDAGRLYRIAGGRVASHTLPAQLLSRVRYVAPAPDGSVWLLLRGEQPGRGVGAVRIRAGRVVQEVAVVGGGPKGEAESVQAALLTDRGDSRLILVTAPERMVIRFDLTTGAAARLVPPAEAGDWAQALPAPDGGALLVDRQGRRRRIAD